MSRTCSIFLGSIGRMERIECMDEVLLFWLDKTNMPPPIILKIWEDPASLTAWKCLLHLSARVRLHP